MSEEWEEVEWKGSRYGCVLYVDNEDNKNSSD